MSKIIKGRGGDGDTAGIFRQPTIKPGLSRSGGGRVISEEEIRARQQAQKLIQEANAKAQENRNEAPQYYQKGYHEGYSAGDEQGKGEIVALILRLNRENEAKFYHFEQDVRRLALQISEKIIGMKPAIDPKNLNQIVKEEFAKIPIKQTLYFFINPEDFKRAKLQNPTLFEEIERAADIELTPSEQISSGSCKIETPIGIFESQLSTQLEVLEKILLGKPEQP